MDETPESSPAPKPCRVLLVEDDDGDAELVTWALRRQERSYLIDRAATLEECLAICRQTEFDVILLDLNLPGVSAFEGLKQVRQLGPGPVIIVLTGFDDPSAVEQAIQAGAQGYLNKNVGANELGRAISSALAGGAL